MRASYALVVAGTAIAAAGCAGAASPEPQEPPVAVDAAPQEPAEWDRELPADVRVVGFHREGTHRLIRVLDDATGQPIAGARIENWGEPAWPHAEDWDLYLAQSLETDADGWALARTDEYGNWWFVQAPGYASLAEMSREHEFRLRPGQNVEVEVRNWLGRRLPGVELEVLIGCGHTASIRTETTDARGRALLRCISPRHTTVWLRGEGIAGRNPAYGAVDDIVPADGGLAVLWADPAPTVEGVVLDHFGSPAAGAVVGTPDAHRGPWCVADAEGRFRLIGAPPREPLAVYYYGHPPESLADAPDVEAPFQAVPGVSPTVRLPAHGVVKTHRLSVLVDPGPLSLTVEFSSDDLPDGSGEARIVAVRESDGRAVLHVGRYVEGRGHAVVPIDAGTWTVTVGSPAGMFRESTRQVTVSEASPARLDFDLDANPVWTPRVFERAADGGLVAVVQEPWTDLDIVTATGREKASVASGGAIHVPASGPFVVEFKNRERRGRVVCDGLPIAPSARIVLPPIPESVPWRGPRDLPAELALPPSTVTVLLPDGSPAAGAYVDIRDSERGRYLRKRRQELDDTGTAEVVFREGDSLTVWYFGDWEVETLEATIDGPGPWTLQWPQTLVEVRAVDEAGAPIEDFDVILSGMDTADGENGVARLWRTTPGPLRFWVSAEDRRSHDLRVLVLEGETRVVNVTLRP